MTEDQVRSLVPDAKRDEHRGFLVAKSGPATLYALPLDGYVVDLFLHWDGDDLDDVLTKAWGPADREPDRETGFPVWRDVETGWRARLNCNKDKGWCEVIFAPHKPLEAMFARPIRPPDELANARLAMPKAELVKLTPMPKDSRVRSLAYDGVLEFVELDNGRLDELSYKLPAAAKPLMAHAWGPSIAMDDSEWFYADASTGWIVEVNDDGDHLRANFKPYQSVDQLLDELVAVAGARSFDAAKAAHPEWHWTDIDATTLSLRLPASPATIDRFGVSRVRLTPGPGSLLAEVRFDRRSFDAVRARMTARWGEPTFRKDDDWRTHLVWPGHGALRADEVYALSTAPQYAARLEIDPQAR